jgi:mannosyltransferase OCH1-like enzyme
MLNYYIGLGVIFIVIVIYTILIILNHAITITVPKYSGHKNNTLVIHRSWHTRQLNPYMYQQAYKKWLDLNPNYTIIWYDDDDCEQFMKNFGDKEYQAWKKLIPTAYKSDLWRACLLYQYGGVYIDCYATPKVSIDEIIKLTKMKNEYFISACDFEENRIHNGFMIATKHHPILKSYINNMICNINVGIEKNMFELTGPICLANTIKNINNKKHHVGLNEGNVNYYLFGLKNIAFCHIMYNNQILLVKKYDIIYCLLYQKIYKYLIGSHSNYYYQYKIGQVCHK